MSATDNSNGSANAAALLLDRPVILVGGRGNDTLTGGEGNDVLSGRDGNDTLSGRGGDDLLSGDDGNDTLLGGDGRDRLLGGEGNDVLVGGAGNDTVDGGDGSDLVRWQSGDGSDSVDGGRGRDTFELTTSDTVRQTVRLEAGRNGRVTVTVEGPGGGVITLDSIEDLDLKVGLAGATIVVGAGVQFSSLDVAGGNEANIIDLSGSAQGVNIAAGGGDDVVTGGGAGDNIGGGDGSDRIAGRGGNDVIDAGRGNDVITWSTGDGSDVVHGGEGVDELDVNLVSTARTTLVVTSNAQGKVLLTGGDGSRQTVDGVEEIAIGAGAGGSTVTIGSLAGTDVAQSTIHFVGGAGADVLDATAADRRVVAESNGGDDTLRSGSGNDNLSGGAGNDTLAGGAGNDALAGGGGNDTLDGGAGNDTLDAGSGVDAVQGGAGNDEIAWTLGDDNDGSASDTLDGGADVDRLTIEVAPGAASLGITGQPNGSASITVSGAGVAERIAVTNVETLVVNAHGALSFALGSLAGTSVGANGVVVNAGAAADVVDGTSLGVVLRAFGNEGDDTLRGGAQADTLAGGAGNDTLAGGAGADSVDGGAGDDLITGGVGDDALTGGAGADRYLVIEPGQSAVSIGRDTITDFGPTDVIDLVPVSALHTLADVLAISRQDGADTLITLDANNSIRLAGVALGSLTAANFVLTPPPAPIVITGTPNADQLLGTAANEILLGLGGNDILVGAGGDDVLDGGDGGDLAHYSLDAGAPGGIIANLSASAITVGGVTVASGTVRDGWGGTDTLVSVESVFGSNFADTIVGSAGVDSLNGGAGNDTISAGDGSDLVAGGIGVDFLDGGAGFDILYTSEGSPGAAGAQMTVNADGSVTTRSALGEVDAGNVNFEAVFGSLANDTIIGNAGDNFLAGSFGSDFIDGGAGVDTVWYGANPGSVLAVDLQAGTSSETFTLPPPAGVTFTGADTLLNIENVIGTLLGDRIFGNAANNVLEGMLGDDVLRGGAGNDTLNGGGSLLWPVPLLPPPGFPATDVDTADYATDPNGVNVDLSAGTAHDGFGGTDTLIGIENVTGSAFADTLYGDFGDNVLVGGDGNDNLAGSVGDDRIDGGAGDDVITGGAWDDTMTGGAGADRYMFIEPGNFIVGTGDDTITDFGSNDILDFAPLSTLHSLADVLAISRQDGADTLITLDGNSSVRLSGVALGSLTAANFAFAAPPAPIVITGTPNADFLRGTPANEILLGLGGNDLLIGAGGDDVLDGGDGFDSAIYSLDVGAPGGIIANLSAAPIMVGGVTVAPGTVRDGWGGTDTLVGLEQVGGSNFADTLIGGAGADSLGGGAGNDIISAGDGNDVVSGGPGIDTLDGGAGFDILFGSDGNPGTPGGEITVNADGSITTRSAQGEVEADNVNFEAAFGSLANDTITGNAGDNFLAGNFGSDVIDGGAGIDTIWYGANQGSVLSVDLEAGTSSEVFTSTLPPPLGGTFFGTDTLRNIENVIGTQLADRITGNAANNVLEGMGGDDILRGGAGNDTLNGGGSLLWPVPLPTAPGSDIDTADYGADPGAVNVDLRNGTARDGYGGTDTLISIENVTGSAFADTLTGNDVANALAGGGGTDTIAGGAGADSVDGGAGDDVITGGAGNDTLTGGAGADRYLVIEAGQTAVNIGNDTITDFGPTDVIDLTPVSALHSLADVLAISRQDGADTLITLDASNSIRLAGVGIGSLTAANFVVTPPAGPITITGTPNADALRGTAANETLLGLGGNDLLVGAGGDDVLDGGDGFDSAIYSLDTGAPGAIIVNLSGAPITVGGVTVGPGTVRDGRGGTDTLVSIENVGGSNFADTMIGSAGGEQLNGANGNDTILAGDGNDTVSGGPGIDTLDGGAGFDLLTTSDAAPIGGTGSQITINADGTMMTRSPAGEVETNIPNFEAALGGSANDTITGNAGDNILAGGFGSDVVDGGAGVDTIWYFSNAGSVLFVDLGAGTSSETFAITPTATFNGADTLLNIENVIGTLVADRIYGNAGNNVLEGLLGDDILRGGAGNDTLNGGASLLIPIVFGPGPSTEVDTADYATDPNGVTVDLKSGTAQDGYGGTDTLIGIENVTGSAFADTLTGGDGANLLAGGAGDDTLAGGLGDDVLQGGAGVDAMDGGDGFDVVDFTADPIAASAPGLAITVAGTTVTSFNAALGQTETAINVEAVRGSLGNDVVTGDGGANTFLVSSGNDQIFGAAGSDTVRFDTAVAVDLAAGTVLGIPGTLALSSIENAAGSATLASADVLRGDAGANVLSGGLGDDVLMGRAGNDTLLGGSSAAGPGGAADGLDTADYSEDLGPVTVNLAAGTAVDGSGGQDTLSSIERVVGSNFADSLTGDAGDNVLTGLGGDDLLAGGGGADTFMLTADAAHHANFGNDTVTDFAVSQDVVNLRAFSDIIGYDALLAHLSQQGADAVLQIDAGDSIRLQNVNVAALTRANFNFVDNLTIIGTDLAETLTGDLGNDNIQGRGGNDTIFGLAGNDAIDGGLGSDTIYGGEGNDTLTDPDSFSTMFGGPGNDFLSSYPDYSLDPSGAVINLSPGDIVVNGVTVHSRNALDGYGGTDTLGPSVTSLDASYFNDYVVGSASGQTFFLFAGNDTAFGLDGQDVFHGGSGNDFMDGGDGFDYVDYAEVEDGGAAPMLQGVRANFSGAAFDFGGGVVLAANTALDGYGGTDTVLNFENVFGTRFADTIVAGASGLRMFGNDGDDRLIGAAGSDYLDGGRGNDVLEGGAGFDTANFSGTTGAVVDLSTAVVANDGFGGIDTIHNVEMLTGSTFDDVFTGSNQSEVFVGYTGNDVFHGGGESDQLFGYEGNDQLYGDDGDFDTLYGDIGNDLLDGGAGSNDTAIFSSQSGAALTSGITVDMGTLVATPFGLAGLVLNDGFGNTDYIRGIETIFATDFADNVTGDAGNNQLIGFGGNDTLRGAGGNDALEGALGNDTLDGGTGDDALNGGENDDVLTGGAGSDFFTFGNTFNGIAVPIGRDVVTDFAVADDTLNLNQLPGFFSLDAVKARATANAQGVLLTVDAQSSIQLNGLTLASLDQMRFMFAPLNGSNGNDVIDGSNGDDVISGLGGDDVINGRGGTDILMGNDGNDMLDGGEGSDQLFGNNGNDVLVGGAGFDVLDSGSGDDLLTGGVGSDRLRITNSGSGFGHDVITDFASDDLLDLNMAPPFYNRATVLGAASQSGTSVIIAIDANSSVTLQNFTLAQLAAANMVFAPLEGTAGNDVLNGTDDGDIIAGLGGDDVLNGLGGDDFLSGNDGNDTLNGGDAGDTLLGFDGNDLLNGGAGNDSLEGQAGDDVLTGGAGSDFFRATGTNGLGVFGDDAITDFASAEDTLDVSQVPGLTSLDAVLAASHQAGADVVIDLGAGTVTLRNLTLAELATSRMAFAPFNGTDGADVLEGSSGPDVMFGNGGNDVLNGHGGGDALYGGAGNDTIDGGDDGDTLIGGTGNDMLDGGAGTDTAYYDTGAETHGAHVDLLVFTASDDGAGGTDSIVDVENLSGSRFDDVLIGDSNPNNLFGGFGNDVLNGGLGNDSLQGWDGDDTLIGGPGFDALTGGAGDDLFVFAPGGGADFIGDFVAGLSSDDVLDLRQIAGFDTFADVQAHLTDTVGGALLDLGGGDSLLLQGVTSTSLAADDFLV